MDLIILLTNITAMNSTNSSSYTIQGIVFSDQIVNLTNTFQTILIGYGYPISLYGSNNTLSNINASLDNFGIYQVIQSTILCQIINASLDASYGIWIYSGSDNNFTNIITDLSADYGIYIYSDLSDSMFSNVDTSSKSLYGYGNGVGIYLGSNSVNNTLSNINASLDNDGIYLGSNSVEQYFVKHKCHFR